MQSLKSLLVTLVVIGGAFLAYDYYLAPEADKIVFKRPASPPPPQAAPAPVVPEPSKPVEPLPRSPLPPPPAPSPMVSSVPPPPPAPPDAGKLADAFVPPSVPGVEHATSNWTRIPPTAFPRTVKLARPVPFKSSFGSMEAPAGSEVSVMSAENGTLTVAPNAKSALRATVALDATDLKAVLTQVYEAWRIKRIEAARYAWEHRNDAPPPPVVSKVPPPARTDGKPEKSDDGTYPLLMASMKTGQVTEVTPSNVTKWGNPEEGDHRGEKCWVVPVDFVAETPFGKFPTVALAKVVNGKVAGWYYQGSGEVVP